MTKLLAKYSTYFVQKHFCSCAYGRPQNSDQFPRPVLVWCDSIWVSHVSLFFFRAIDTVLSEYWNIVCTDWSIPSHPSPSTPGTLFICLFISSSQSLSLPYNMQLDTSYKSSTYCRLLSKAHFVIHFNEYSFINVVWLNKYTVLYLALYISMHWHTNGVR